MTRELLEWKDAKAACERKGGRLATLVSSEENYDVALNMLQGKESPAAAVPRVSAVTLLAELTSRIPNEQGIKLEQVTVDLDRISLRVTADNSKAIDIITQSLTKYRCFQEV